MPFTRPHGRRRQKHTPGRTTTEALEERIALTAIAWANAPELSLSFAPDGTSVGGHESRLHDVFDRIAPREEWMEAILNAFDSWTSHIDAEVTTRDDNGDPFGTNGPAFDDPRFGEIRVAAIPANSDAYAFSISHDEFVSGTWSGDIVFNSSVRFESVEDIYGVALHEAGHVLGLEHSHDPNSPMFEHGIAQALHPTADDIEQLLSLYGEPKQPGESSRIQREDPDQDDRNHAFEDAVVLNPTTGFKYGRYTLEGEILDGDDADVYRFEGYPHKGNQSAATTIVIRSTNRGHLIPKATLYQANGNPVPNVRVVQNGNGVLILETTRINPRQDYFLRIESAADGNFGAGEYQLTIASRPEGLDPADFVKGSVTPTEPISQHTLFVSRPQLLNLSLVVDDRDDSASDVGIVVHDALGRVVTVASAALGETRSLPSLLLRGGTYYLTVEALSEAEFGKTRFNVVGVRLDEESGPLPSDPTGDPAFPCEASPDHCYVDGTVSPDPTHTVPGIGEDPPDFDPYVIPLPWIGWWPDDATSWLSPVDDSVFAIGGTSSWFDVTANDMSIAPNEIQSVAQPANGVTSLEPDGGVTFEPEPGFYGTSHFEYTLGTEQTRVDPGTLNAGDRFGSSIDVHGTLAVFGSPYADTQGTDSGSVYVYHRDGGDWLFVQELTAADGTANDRFGTSVAAYGSTIVATSPRDDDLGTNSGGVYVFEFDSTLGQFIETAKLLDLTGDSKDLFGGSVAIDGDTIVVGARSYDGTGVNSGSAFVFERMHDEWALTKQLEASDASADSHFGSSVAIFRNTVVVGARRANGNGVNSGAAYVFDRDAGGPNNFGEVTRLVPGDVNAGDEFGSSVAVHQDSIVVGAPQRDGAVANQGGAWLFRRLESGDWQETQLFEGGAGGDQMGSQVDVFEETIAVASPTADVGGVSNAGRVQIFEPQPSGSWALSREINSDVSAAGDQFGSSVAIFRNTVTIGSARSDASGLAAGQVSIEDLRTARATVTVTVGQPLLASSSASSSLVSQPIDQTLLNQHLDTARQLWNFSGDVEISSASLPGNLLGLAVGARIFVDDDAAGHGWRVGAKPEKSPSPKSGGVDLLTVIAHELGHVLGRDDLYGPGSEDDLMFGFLAPGVRRIL